MAEGSMRAIRTHACARHMSAELYGVCKGNAFFPMGPGDSWGDASDGWMWGAGAWWGGLSELQIIESLAYF